MPKKTPKQIKKEHDKIQKYKWEFLRRNKKYQQGYDKFNKADTNFYRDNPDATEEDYDTWLQAQQAYFDEKWFINWPLDYKRKKPRPHPRINIGMDHPVIICNKKNNCNKGDMLLFRDGRSERIPQQLGICVDLNYPKGVIKTQVEKVIDDAVDARTKAFKKYRYKKDFRQAQLTLYDTYLKVWDLSNKNKKGGWIAKKIYPNDENSYDSGYPATHRIMEEYKECKKLIDGDYVNIK